MQCVGLACARLQPARGLTCVRQRRLAAPALATSHSAAADWRLNPLPVLRPTAHWPSAHWLCPRWLSWSTSACRPPQTAPSSAQWPGSQGHWFRTARKACPNGIAPLPRPPWHSCEQKRLPSSLVVGPSSRQPPPERPQAPQPADCFFPPTAGRLHTERPFALTLLGQGYTTVAGNDTEHILELLTEWVHSQGLGVLQALAMPETPITSLFCLACTGTRSTARFQPAACLTGPARRHCYD